MVQGRPGDERGRGVSGGGPGGAGQRLFVAVPLPAETLGFVVAAQRLLPSLSGLRLMREDQLHVTLAFIGEVGDDKARAARQVVESVPVEMGGEAIIERFLLLPSPGRARVVALELNDGDHVFARLCEEVMGGLERAGVMQRERRPFRPHLTIARLRDPGPVQPRSECGEARYAVESVCLYESELKREGALYTVCACAALACKKA
jgi:RNA 2',3'-cyclic 3'-phosphodiesterase